MVIVYSYFYLLFGRNQLLLVEKLSQVRMIENLLDADPFLGVEFEHFTDEVHALLVGIGHQISPIALLQLAEHFEDLMAST